MPRVRLLRMRVKYPGTVARSLVAILLTVAVAASVARAQQPLPDLSGTWVMNVAKSRETGRTLQFDTTIYTRVDSTYRVDQHFDHGHGANTLTEVWPVGTGQYRAADPQGFTTHVITRVQGDTLSYLSEIIVDGQTVQYESGRTWLSPDGHSRTLAFDADVGQGRLAHGLLVFDKRVAAKPR
jgi:hypothetical protein